MELYVNPQITDFRQDVNGDIKMLKIGQKKEDAWANIAEQSGKKLDNNKTATINVSTYTEPVEVLPTSGKDGMKKATITLSNIPSPSSGATAYAWGGYGVYLPFSVAPATMTQTEIENQMCFYIKPARVGFESASVMSLGDYLSLTVGEYTSLTYEKTSDTKFTISVFIGEEETPIVFELVSEYNFTLWQENE